MAQTNTENPVNATTARAQLGQPGKPWGRSRMSAIKRAMNITARYFYVSEVREWLKENQNFREADIYPRKPKKEPPGSPQGLRAAGVGMNGEPSLKHAQ